jgi:hypothetical protein
MIGRGKVPKPRRQPRARGGGARPPRFSCRFLPAGILIGGFLGLGGLGHAHPVPPLPHQPEVRFCVLDYSAAPSGLRELDEAVKTHARAEILTYSGNIRKWWFPLPRDSGGKTVRDLHPGVRILQYLSAAEFPAVASVHNPMRSLSGSTAYAHTRTFTVPEYLRIARLVGGPVPDIRDPKPYGFGDGILVFFGGPDTLRANTGGAHFIDHAKRYARLIKKLGGDGVFLDNLAGTVWFLPGVTAAGGNPIRLPPWCFRMQDGRYYWHHVREGREVPSLADLKAGKKEAVAQIRDLDNCRATGAPKEWRTRTDLELAELTLVRELKAEEAGMVVFNGLYIFQAEHALKLLEIADGALMEGFVEGQRPQYTMANLDLARRAGKSGKSVILLERLVSLEAARFSYAAYLLVAAPNVCWGTARKVVEVPEMDVMLGPARGTYRMLPEGEGRADRVVFHRQFERGDVFLNPQKRPMPIPGGTIPAESGVVRPRGLADAF